MIGLELVVELVKIADGRSVATSGSYIANPFAVPGTPGTT